MKALDIYESVDLLLSKMGEEITVIDKTVESKVKAVIQPLRYKNKLYLDMKWGNLGFKDAECFLYIGPPKPDFAGREIDIHIKSADRAYCVSRADRITLAGKTVYIWAVLTPKIKENAYDLD